MKVLLIGSGGREHAIAHAISKSPSLTSLFVAPGNPGTFQCAKNVPISSDDIPGLVSFALTEGIDMTIVGPEQPLVLGIVDAFETKGLAIVGPTKAAAQLEGSKAWAKKKYQKYGIPTADYGEFHSFDDALAYVKHRNSYPIVIKADGLAAGKGVVIAPTLDVATKALSDCFIDCVFKDAGQCVVIEDFLVGEEASLFAFTDGTTVRPMVSAQDHKAIFDGDKGPNTGGMGAYSPAPVFTRDVEKKVMDRILIPLVKGLADDGIDYKGILYAGLMIDAVGDPYVVEFNIRLGDPETQIVLPKLQSDILMVFQAIVNHQLDQVTLKWDDTHTVGVVMASEGYPGSYASGHLIDGLNHAADMSSYVFHAGTQLNEQGQYLTHGGRVLTVCAEGASLKDAISSAYKRCERISFDGAYYRKDIGQKGLAHIKNSA